MAIDAKYGEVEVEGIPADEPIFIIRAQDSASVQTITNYADNATRAGADIAHTSSARAQAARFSEWQEEEGHNVKTPD